MGNMKVHQFARGFWEQHEPSLTLGCKRLRPLAPKLPNNTTHEIITTPSLPFDLKISFLRPEISTGSSSDSVSVSDDNNININNKKKDHPTSPRGQVETHPGGTRWNPTQEQIGILEMLYKGGMRTPNAQQIEQITVQLGKYGKIEGKNVFYWFQNHKARERQKQKRNTLALSHHTDTPTIHTSITNFQTTKGEVAVERDEEDSPYKKCRRRWVFECLEEEKSGLMGNEEEEEQRTTLELFPLHPESRS